MTQPLCFVCRGDPTRTGDHLVPNQVRYQLRYTPESGRKGTTFGEKRKEKGEKNEK